MAADHDPEVFLNTFERIATVAGWPQDQWALRLTPCLTGLAQKVVEALDLGEAADYDKVKQAILGTLNLSAEAYRKRFRELRLEPGRSPRAVGQEMKANARRWLQPEMHFAEQVVELVVLEQLVTTLEPALRSWVTSQQPLTLEDAVTLLEAYWEAEAIWGVAAVPPQKNGQGQKKGEGMMSTGERTAHSSGGACERAAESVPSSENEQEDRGVQTDETGEARDRCVKLLKDFPNLMVGGGLLSTPADPHGKDNYKPRGGWNWGTASPKTASGMKKNPAGSSPFLPRLEGTHVKHPCCNTVCAVLSIPVQNPVIRYSIGVRRI
ncbi:uncharacterized protein LOC110090082 isoform X3 [Pogona vitticeps]